MKYIIVRKKNVCYGHGDYRDEYVIEVFKLFDTKDDADKYIIANNLYNTEVKKNHLVEQ